MSVASTPGRKATKRFLDAPRRFFAVLFDSESAEQAASKEPTHELAAALSNFDLAVFIRRRLYEDKDWARSRRAVWSARASATRIVIRLSSALATVFLGIAFLDGFAVVGFIFSAIVTTTAGLESFFNWRSRWVASDVALARWHDLEESLALYVAAEKKTTLDRDKLLTFDSKRREIWAELSQTWVSERQNGSRTANIE